MKRTVAAAACFAAATLGCLTPGAAGAAAPLAIGLDAYGPLGSTNAAVRGPLLAIAARDGAGVLRMTVDWAAVAPKSPPASFAPRDPADPAYHWAGTDALVRSAAAAHLRILLVLADAPVWAEGPGAPAGTAPGSWRPNPSAFGDFARAAALRYSGRFADPLDPGHALPRVRDWEAWNEPNLWLYLTPQWVRHGRGFRAAGPGIYRGLLNALYTGVKSVSRANLVVAGATAPFGDLQTGGRRIPPVTFVRDMLCLRPDGHRARGCGEVAHFDALDHHPFDVGGPLQHAINAGDVSVPDMGKLTRLLAAARKARTLFPRRRKQVWATELAWVSRPPDRSGVPLLRQAHWLEQAFYVLWRQGVSTALWLELVDDPPGGLAAGLYFRSGVPKPAASAFSFPFVASRRSRGHVLAWGRSPVTGSLLIQRRTRRGWMTIRRHRERRGATFALPLHLTGGAVLRARVGAETSLPWPVAR